MDLNININIKKKLPKEIKDIIYEVGEKEFISRTKKVLLKDMNEFLNDYLSLDKKDISNINMKIKRK